MEDSLIIACEHCGTKNRIPRQKIHDRPLCGKCYQRLSQGKIYDHPLDINDQVFAQEVIQFPGPVLVDCWAQWCGPCQMMGPVLDQIAREYAGKIKIVKLNVDENPVTSSQYSIQSIPTMLIFKDGKVMNRLVGALPKSQIEDQIKLVFR